MLNSVLLQLKASAQNLSRGLSITKDESLPQLVRLDSTDTGSSEGLSESTTGRSSPSESSIKDSIDDVSGQVTSSRPVQWQFFYENDAFHADNASVEAEPYLKMFEEFIQAIKDEYPTRLGEKWRLECSPRKNKEHVLDLYFFDGNNRCFRSKAHLLRIMKIEEEVENESESDSEEEELERRPPSTRVKYLLKKKQLESCKRVTRSQTKKPEKSKSKKTSKPISDDNSTETLASKKLKPATDVETFINLLDESRKILIVIGAGVSTAAGVPDFRTKSTGLYSALSKHFRDTMPPEVLFDGETFEQDPAPFYEFASKTFLPLLENAKPTITHEFVSLLAKEGKLLRCYTQNVDGLERMARLDEKYLVECHGTMRSARCMSCGKRVSQPYWWKARASKNHGIPECHQNGCKGDLRPNMIFFGEQVPGTIDQRLMWDVDKCDLVVVVGTSLSVQPVSRILSSVPKEVPRVWINKALPPPDRDFSVVLTGPCDTFTQDVIRRCNWT